jgi:hypothetical protein
MSASLSLTQGFDVKLDVGDTYYRVRQQDDGAEVAALLSVTRTTSDTKSGGVAQLIVLTFCLKSGNSSRLQKRPAHPIMPCISVTIGTAT